MNKHISSEMTQAIRFKEMSVICPALEEARVLPSRFTCDGENVSPPLEISRSPDETKSLAIIMTGTYDGRQEWAHWLAWNIPPIHHIVENRDMEMEGLNYFSRRGYDGPCPGGGLHHYTIKVYAIDTVLKLPSATLQAELEKAMSEHILAIGVLTFSYRRAITLG